MALRQSEGENGKRRGEDEKPVLERQPVKRGDLVKELCLELD